MKQAVLRTIGFLGVLLFVPLFLFTFADPQVVETTASSFVEWKLQKEANEKIDGIGLGSAGAFERRLGQRAADLRHKAEAELENIKRQLREDAPAILAAQIAKMRNLDCECRKKWEKHIRVVMEFAVFSLEQARKQLTDFTQARYMEIVHKLTLDVRIFLGTNAVIFILLLVISFLRPVAVGHLFLPGILMLVSTVICSYFYLFEQNWFFTVIFDNYTGFAFVGYCTFVFAILCDIVFNRARITTWILNSIAHSIGQGGSFVPC